MIKYQQVLFTVLFLPGNADALNKVDHNFHLFALRTLARRVNNLIPRDVTRRDSLPLQLIERSD